MLGFTHSRALRAWGSQVHIHMGRQLDSSGCQVSDTSLRKSRKTCPTNHHETLLPKTPTALVTH